VVALGGYFGEPSDRLLNQLLGEQLKDGGWNCEAERGSVRSSFHTTICVLEGLLEYEKAKGATAAETGARVRAQEYLLQRRMFRRLSSGEVINRN
jgi:squalene cyclase